MSLISLNKWKIKTRVGKIRKRKSKYNVYKSEQTEGTFLIENKEDEEKDYGDLESVLNTCCKKPLFVERSLAKMIIGLSSEERKKVNENPKKGWR